MSSSDLSDLSSPLSTDDDLSLPSIPSNNLDHYFKNASGHPAQASPPAKKKRPPSPPHEYVLADNPDIAVSIKNFRKLRATILYKIHSVVVNLTYAL